MDKPSTSRQQDVSELDADNPGYQESNKRKLDSDHEEPSSVKKTELEQNFSLVSVPQSIKTVNETESPSKSRSRSPANSRSGSPSQTRSRSLSQTSLKSRSRSPSQARSKSNSRTPSRSSSVSSVKSRSSSRSSSRTPSRSSSVSSVKSRSSSRSSSRTSSRSSSVSSVKSRSSSRSSSRTPSRSSSVSSVKSRSSSRSSSRTSSRSSSVSSVKSRSSSRSRSHSRSRSRSRSRSLSRSRSRSRSRSTIHSGSSYSIEVQDEDEAVEKTSSLTAESPEVLHILPLIFRYLGAVDLINAKKVCTLWESVTDNTSVWKHAPLRVYMDDVNILANTPYLHTIILDIVTSEVGNKLLDAVMSNVIDFRKLDFMIESYGWNVPTIVFQNFIKKFPNLESIIVSNCVPAMVESLELLSKTNLKALSLLCNDQIKNFSDMCIVVSTGFLALRKLYITHMFPGTMQNFKTGVSILLKKKINQLTDLSLYYSDVYSDVLDMILKSAKLQKLEIRIEEWPKIPLDLTGMTSLKSLSLESHYLQSETLRNHWLMYLKFPQNLQYLYIHFYCDLKLPTGVINNVINSLPNLRVLIVEKIFDPDLDEQLENVSKLSNLHTVCLTGCPSLSAKGVEHILKCRKLCELDIGPVSFTESTYESLKGCKYLGRLALEECILNPDELVSAMLSMKYLTNLHIFKCKLYTKRGVLDFLNNYMIKKIRVMNPQIKVCRCFFNLCVR